MKLFYRYKKLILLIRNFIKPKKLYVFQLEEGKYYCINNKTDKIKYYIKYKYQTIDHIFTYGFHLVERYKNKNEFILWNPSIMGPEFCSIAWLKTCLITKIDIKEIVDDLPDEFPDKINYIRQQKINFLLKN